MNFNDGTYELLGAAIAVQRKLGNGYTEEIYEEAYELELGDCGIYFERQVPLKIKFGDRILRAEFRADLIVQKTIIVELKAVSTLSPAHCSQVLNYLNATGLQIGLLINFGSPKIESRRFILTPKPPDL